MNKRDITDKIFIGVAAFVLISIFIPAIRVDAVKNGIVHSSYSAVLDANASLIILALPAFVAIIEIFGKRVLASVLGFITCIVNGFVLFYYDDMATTAVKTFDNEGPFAALMMYGGVESISTTHIIGFYLVVAGIVLLAIFSIINLLVKDEGHY